MMCNRFCLSTALLLAVSAGCSDGESQKQQIGAAEEAFLAVRAQEGDTEAAKKLEKIQKMRAASPQDGTEVAPDIRDGWQWSADEVAALTKRANSGDMEAADRLLQYYSVHEDAARIGYWEDWLFKRGHPGAIRSRAYRLYSASEKRSSDDPLKLIELKAAERLERSVATDDEKLFLNKIREEISVLEKITR
jgi:hypothetical protein